MKWIAIAGGWRKTDFQIEEDVKRTVREIISRGDGIVSDGALGVDYLATDEVLKLGCDSKQIKIFIPSTLEIYKAHYLNQAKERVVTEEQVKLLVSQLEKIKKMGALVEGKEIILNKETYFNRITEIIKNADKLVAFHVNKTEGTQDTIDKAKKKNIPVKIFNYLVE
jgi:hypothetical protein